MGGYFTDDGSRAPGDYANGGVLGVPNASGPMEDQEARKKKLNAEITNGRLAMMAIIGMFFQDGLTGSAWGDWELYTGSPLRAFETELGAQPPLGFWDPLGFCDDGDAVVFRRRRILELKHGRVSMLAAVGYIVPEYFKFDFLIAPSVWLKGVAIDNGLAALKALPPEGWAQMFAFCGYLEFGPLKQDESRKPG